MTTITVFGGTGFLGRRLVQRLVAEGVTVRVAVRHPDPAEAKSERPLDPRVSPYLRRPLRTLKEAEQDSDASGYHMESVSLPLDSPASPGHRGAASPRKQP